MIQVDTQELSKIKPILTSIGVISKESMIEQSSKAGNKVRVAVRRSFIAETTKWSQEYKNGRRILRKRNNYNAVLGKRIAHRKGGGIDDPAYMANFITSFTHETTGTTVIGGTHKAFYPSKIRDGKIVGRLGRVGGVSGDTKAILAKLNYGNMTEGMGGSKGKYKFLGGGTESMKDGAGNPLSNRWKRRLFFEKGWSMSKGQVLEDMTTRLAELIGERANRDMEKRYAV